MSDAVTIVAIVVPAVVSGAVAAASLRVSWKRGERDLGSQERIARERFDHESRQADLDGLRRVLDDAAVMLHRLERALSKMSAQVSHHAADVLDRESGRAALAALDEAGVGSDLLVARLEVRRGKDHDLVRALRRAADAGATVSGDVALMSMSAPREEITHPYAVQRRQEIGDRTINSVIQELDRFRDARDEFMAAAAAEGGAATRQLGQSVDRPE